MNTARPLICLVDDTIDYHYFIQRIVKKYYPLYLLRAFSSGHDFLQALPYMKEKPSLVLLDQHMPGLDGYQTLVALKQLRENHAIPVVMFSAFASNSEKSLCYQAGANAFVEKPEDYITLEQAVGEVFTYCKKPLVMTIRAY